MDGDDTPPANRRQWLPVFLRLLGGNLLAGLAVFLLAGGQKMAEIWYRVDANSLVGLQAFVEQKLDPDELDTTLYFDYVLPVIELPAWFGAIVLFTLFDALRLAAVWPIARGVSAMRRKVR